MCKLRHLLSLILITICIPTINADTYPKRELRSAWVTTAWGNDWPTSTTVSEAQAEAIEYIELLKENGFNTVFLQVRPMSDRLYAKNSYDGNTVYEPWSSYVSGKRATDPGWDPLEFWIEECHKRGLELHAWVNPYRFGNRSGEDYSYPFSTTNDVSVTDQGWIINYYNKDTNITYFIFNPCLSQVKSRITTICKVLTGNYDIDGIVFDDYFYPEGIPEDETASDYSNYQSYISDGGTMTIADWRRNHVNDMVSQVYTAIKAIKPYVKFGISPAGAAYDGLLDSDGIPPMSDYCTAEDWQYDKIYSDPMNWMRNKTIDYVSPQLYWKMDHSSNGFDEMSTWWNIAAEKFGRHFYASHSISFIGSSSAATTTNFDEVVNQINANRQTAVNNNPGSVMYSLRNFSGKLAAGLAPYLKENTFQYNAITPAATWYTATDPGAPTNLKLSSGTLTWDAVTVSDGAVSGIGMRYAIYAIPLTISPKDAASEIHINDGGYKSEYLVDLTYSNTYDISAYSTSNYWYAVTIVDRYGNEWDASTLNAPIFEEVNVSLVSPSTGSTIGLTSQVFSWTGDENATYTFQISGSSDFSTILTEKTTTETSVDISSGIFDENTTYYWRVTAKKTGYVSTTTDAWTFISPILPTIEFSLTSPESGATIDESAQVFSWTSVDNATFTFEISTESTFANPVISSTSTSNVYDLDTKTLAPNTTYYWRVAAAKEQHKNSVSETRSFITPDQKTWAAPVIWGPTDKETVDFDISFVVTKTYETVGTTRNYADATYLEISKTPDFSELYFSGHSNWQENTHEGVIWLQYTVPVSYFTNGLYYWRARATKEGWPDGISKVRTFTVIDQSDNETTSYSMVREGYEYPVKAIGINGYSGSLTLTNLWIRSEEKGNALDVTQASSGLYRGLCARHDNNGDQDYKDILWIAGRTANWGGTAFLDKYDAATGEYLGQLQLSSGYITTYPCNDIFLDDANNLCVHNLAGKKVSSSAATLQILTVNPKTGEYTERFSTTIDGRVDHARVVGDITSGNFYVLATDNSSFNAVYRWTVTNGTITAAETQTITGYYPATAANFDLAPRIYPVSSEYFYIDGTASAFSLYKWGQATPVGDFSSVTTGDTAPTRFKSNGGTYFTHNGIPMIVYSSDDYEGDNGYKFSVASVPAGHSSSFAGITKYWTIPSTFFGTTSNGGGDYAALADYLQYDASTGYAITRSSTNDMTKIFLYVPGNGLAAYTLIQHIVTGEEQTLATRQANVTIANGLIHFGREVESASLYSLSGALVSSTSNSSFMEAPGSNGVYILGINNNGINSTHKIIIK